MMMSADKVGGWVKKGQNHDDVILEWSLRIHEIQVCRNDVLERLSFPWIKSPNLCYIYLAQWLKYV